MSRTDLAAALPLRHSPRAGLLDRFARRAVWGRLARVRGGRVTISDARTTRHFGGSGPLAATITVTDGRAWRAIALGGSVGAADGFTAGWWTVDDLVSLLRIFVRDAAASDTMESGLARLLEPARRLGHALRRNTRRGSRRNIHAHYDLGNELFALFLDPTMTYSCGIFESPRETMEQASVRKLDRACRKLGLREDHHLLEIGSGWGSMAIHAARHYGCRVTTTTVSRAQHALARARVAEAGLADRVEVLLTDYRDLEGRFDRIASIEMIEAVGHAYLPDYFRQCGRLLARDGLALVQAITMPDHRYERYRRETDFIRQRIFPGSNVPSLSALAAAMAAASDLRLVHLEDLTPHYATTLRRWREAFHAESAAVRRLGYDERFIRLWTFYLCYCEAGFAERYTGNVQLLLARPDARPAPIAPCLAETTA